MDHNAEPAAIEPAAPVVAQVVTPEPVSPSVTPERRALSDVTEVRAVDREARTITFEHTRGLDRHGTLIEPSAWLARLDRFERNPVFLWAHDMRMPPIGTLEVWPNGSVLEVSPDKIRYKVRFAKTAFASEIFGLYQDGILKAASHQFYILQERPPTPEELQQHGIELRAVVTAIELLELSAVPVGSNPNALAKQNAEAGKEAVLAHVRAVEDLLAYVQETHRPAAGGEKRAIHEHAEAVKAAAQAMVTAANGVVDAVNGMIEALAGEKKPDEKKPDEKPGDGNGDGKPEPKQDEKQAADEVERLLRSIETKLDGKGAVPPSSRNQGGPL